MVDTRMGFSAELSDVAGPDARERHEAGSITSVLIHIGYPKTGSTWAQNKLFGSAECGFCNLFPHNRDLKQLNAAIIGPGAFSFDPQEARRFIDRRIEEVAPGRLRPVITAESLAGNHFAPGQFDARIIAERLRAVFPEEETRVLIIIREQRSMILSRYSQFVRGGGWKSIERYLDAFDVEEFPRWSFLYRDYLRYDRLIEFYQRLFGADRVLVLPFELLPTDPVQFVRRIIDFAGAQMTGEMPSFVNTKSRISAASVGFRRWVNPFITVDRGNPFGVLMPQAIYYRYARLLRRLDGPIFSRIAGRSERRLKERIAKLAEGHYAASNRRASELIGVDLRSYGYEC